MIQTPWQRFRRSIFGTAVITAMVCSSSSCTIKIPISQTPTCLSDADCADGRKCRDGQCLRENNCGSAPNGGTETRECYASAIPYGATCASTTQTRTCDHGIWNPDFPACANLTCAAGCEMPRVPNDAVNVRAHGARGDGQTDDTAAINAAVAAVGAGGTVFVPDGTYLVKAVDSSCVRVGIKLKSNITFLMSANAVIKALPNSCRAYAIMSLDRLDQVVIAGGTIEGERDEHTVPSGQSAGEWGMGIQLMTATNITIKRITVRDCWGDGIYVGTYRANSEVSRNVTVCGVLLEHNRRCNFTAVSASGLTLSDSIMRNAIGTNPQSGFCGEPNPGKTDVDDPASNGLVENVTISNCQLVGNHNMGGYFGGPAPAIARNNTVKNCVISNNGADGFQVSGNRGYDDRYGESGMGHLLQDNVFEDNGWTNPRSNGYTSAVDFIAARQNTASGNIFRHNANRGFSMSGSTDSIVRGNSFIDNGSKALYFRWFANNNQVIDNSCQGANPTIDGDGQASGNTISANHGCTLMLSKY